MEGASIVVFIRKGANLAHFFSQMSMRQKLNSQFLKFLTVRLVIGPSSVPGSPLQSCIGPDYEVSRCHPVAGAEAGRSETGSPGK